MTIKPREPYSACSSQELKDRYFCDTSGAIKDIFRMPQLEITSDFVSQCKPHDRERFSRGVPPIAQEGLVRDLIQVIVRPKRSSLAGRFWRRGTKNF